MIFQFTVDKHVDASPSNIIANYLDLQHLPSHSGLSDCRVLSETDCAASFALTSKIGPFKFRNVHYFEYRPPLQIFQAIKSPLGPMTVLATTRQTSKHDEPMHSVVQVDVTLDMPSILYPFRNLLKFLLTKVDHKVLEEDNAILRRRQKLFGDSIQDYLQPENKLLFKEVFREVFSKESSNHQKN